MPSLLVRGHRCVYERAGQGPNLTLLHSVGLSTREGWRAQVQALSKNFTVLSFDFRGLGESAAGDAPLGVETFAADIDDLHRQLGVSRTALMGVSLGGFVAQAYALAYPEQLSALVLVSTASKIFAGYAERRAARNAKIRAEGMKAAAAHQLASHFPDVFSTANPDVLAWYDRHYQANDPERYIAIMDDLGRFDSAARLPSLTVPTLIVAGSLDNSSVAGREPLDSAKTLQRLIPGSRLEVIDGAFHYPHIDHAAEFNARVAAFLQGKA